MERAALGLLRRNSLRPQDFEREASGAVRLRPDAKRAYLEALESDFATPSALLGSETPGTLHEQLWQQATAYALACAGQARFQALRYR